MNSNLFKKCVTTSLLAGCITSAGFANAAFTVRIDSGDNGIFDETVVDDLAGDQDSLTPNSIVLLNQTVSAYSFKTINGEVDVDTLLALGGNGKSLQNNSKVRIEASDTDFTAYPTKFLTSSTRNAGSTKVTVDYFYSANNVLFDKPNSPFADHIFLATNPLAQAGNSEANLATGPNYSLTISVLIESALSGQKTNFSSAVSASAVPLPAAFWLFGSALFGGFFTARKRAKKVSA